MDETFSKTLLSERKQILNILRQTSFTSLDPEIVHKQIVPLASYSPWETDKLFKQVYNSIRENTLVDIYRCYELWELTKQLNGEKGDIIEVGVWKGGTGALIAKAASDNTATKVYLCDTFTGVVKAGENDTNYKGGEHADTTENEVISLMKTLALNNYSISKGIFPDDFKDDYKNAQFKFCHIDVDTYASAKEIYDYVWTRLIPGGIIAFDDVGIWGCEGVTKLFNQISTKHARKIYNLNGHGIIIKS